MQIHWVDRRGAGRMLATTEAKVAIRTLKRLYRQRLAAVARNSKGDEVGNVFFGDSESGWYFDPTELDT